MFLFVATVATLARFLVLDPLFKRTMKDIEHIHCVENGRRNIITLTKGPLMACLEFDKKIIISRILLCNEISRFEN